MAFDYFDIFSPVVTGKEMARIDRYTIENIGIPGIVLMENAGRAVAARIKQMLGDLRSKKVVVVCGKGNNGGDGYVVARYLLESDATVDTYLVGKANDVKGDAATNLLILKNLGHKVHEVSRLEHISIDAGAHLVVDALLGTGVRGPLAGLLSDIVAKMGEVRAPILSVDIPTGVQSDTGLVDGACIKAQATVTMALPKRGLLFSPGREQCGDVAEVDIGIPKFAVKANDVKCFRLNDDGIRRVLPERATNAFKNRCGQVFLLAGSQGLTGAAVLSAEAVLRIGAGMALLGIPKSLNGILEEKLTEVMTVPLAETELGCLSLEAKGAVAEKLPWSDVLAVGPGLSTHADVATLLKWLVTGYDKPMVLDADAINCFSGEATLLEETKAALVLTPHPGELARLIGIDVKTILAEPIEVAREWAKRLNVVLVLKGAPTVVGSADGSVFINSTGNAGMATAGMGDVLTGVIAGLIAQGMTPLDAALAGVYIHGFAGDIASSRMGERGLISRDVLESLPFALKNLQVHDIQN
ncbi:MAG: NAD(P)H-hydrate dehydratase [bacterium]